MKHALGCLAVLSLMLLSGCDFFEKERVDPKPQSMPLDNPNSPQVTAPPLAEKVVAGESHTCAIVRFPTKDKKGEPGVQCWGDNTEAQLGSGQKMQGASPPARVQGLTAGEVTFLVAGKKHSCAAVGEHVFCWGSNHFGELGNGSHDNGYVATPVKDLQGKITALAAGDHHTCAIVDSGVMCWGKNDKGQLTKNVEETCPGDKKEKVSCSTSAIPVDGADRGIEQIVAGSQHTCALDDKDQLTCWGSNQFSQLVNQQLSTGDLPLDDFLIAAGGNQTCVRDGGDVKCWGQGYDGKVAKTAPAVVKKPQQLSADAKIESLSIGVSHACAVLDDKALYCWGKNDHKVLHVPSPGVKGALLVAPEAFSVAAGGSHTCAVMSTTDYEGRGVRCWGFNDKGQLGISPDPHEGVIETGDFIWALSWLLPQPR